MAINIPSSEILTPDLHADELGYVFFWQGHLLRGIFPEAVGNAKEYFNSGFIDEIVNLGFFPKTWISEFKNEQFGLILEHEYITPTLYALEWNISMLRDAALMVLDIALVANRYGYNMIDCHKLNVMFKDNKPMFVDLGSFVKNQPGCTAWHPYESFFRSYYNILNIWNTGAPQIAKRLMAPGVEFDEVDYRVFKNPIYRHLNGLLKFKLKFRSLVISFCCADDVRFNKALETKNNIERFLLKSIRAFLNCKVLSCQYRFKSIINKISRMGNLDRDTNNSQKRDYSSIIEKAKSYTVAKTALVLNCKSTSFYQDLIDQTAITQIISVQENQKESQCEYEILRHTNLPVVCTCFRMLNGIIITRHKSSEERFKSDIVIIPDYELGSEGFSKHNYNVLVDTIKYYSANNIVISNIQ